MENYYIPLHTFALFPLYNKVGTGGTTSRNAYVAFILNHDCYFFPQNKENQVKNLEEETLGAGRKDYSNKIIPYNNSAECFWLTKETRSLLPGRDGETAVTIVCSTGVVPKQHRPLKEQDTPHTGMPQPSHTCGGAFKTKHDSASQQRLGH